MSADLLDEIAGERESYRTSKGTLRFPLGKPLAAGLIRKIVKARVAQNASKAKA